MTGLHEQVTMAGADRAVSSTEATNDAERPCGEEPLEELVASVAGRLAGVPAGAGDEAVNAALAALGQHQNADWAFVLRQSDDGRLLSAAFQWRSAADASPLRLSGIASELVPTWAAQLGRRQPVLVADVAGLPAGAGSERQLLESHGIRATALLPMGIGRGAAGFLGLAWTVARDGFERRSVHLLQLAALALAGALERERTERSLRDSQRNLDILLDSSDDYLFILDPVFRVLYANPNAVDVLGHEIRQLRHMTAVDLFPAHHRSEVQRALAGPALRPGHALLAALLAYDGSHVAVETRITRGSWNSQDVLFLFCRDVTERARALDGLRRFEARSTAILKAIPDAMLRLRGDGTVIDFTPADGVPGQEVAADGETVLQLAQACRGAGRKALSTGERQVCHLELGAAGGQRTFEARLSVLGEDEVLAIIRDISERSRLEKMKDDFINRASHELRTPLTTALLMVELIREGGETAELDEYWDVLRLELQRQHELVEDLLTVSKLESGAMVMSPVSVDLIPLLEDAVENASGMAAARRQTLLRFVPAGLPQVKGDAATLRRVFANLLDNAVKFTPAGGEVRLEARAQAEGVSVRVRDNGIGIPRSELSQLFQRFFRASNAVRAEIQGAGIGLYVVRSIVEGHGGWVTVKSALDEGATFEVWLPVGRQEKGLKPATIPPRAKE
jgi:PAS domain S-box-containing protein